ncbi:putative oxidoreductase YjhC [Cladobotryum mycophilum]|uniref:Oxidoreductase YjhC n=1 Tax=Cladobotryum mycophilum TaxID=491253 RepID=A0ABR0SFB6_9HYPO
MAAIQDLLSKSTGDKPSPIIEPPQKPEMSQNPPRFIIIGAGSRGLGYAKAIDRASNGVVAAVADPIKFKRDILGRNHIWRGGGGDGDDGPKEGQSFPDWREFLGYELNRRQRVTAGERDVPEGVDGAFVCVLDEMHREVVVGLAPLGLHIMCEKPLAPSFNDCLDMYKALKPFEKSQIFSIGHVLRYSPHNMLLRKLLVEDKVIGNISSATHTEPVGWWHFTHSYVRGNWRNERTSAPSLLTKCCHDIDLMLWLLCSPEKCGQGEPHLPKTVSSTGGLQFFKRSRKPAAAGPATNCMRCPLGDSGCKYSAKHIYLGPRYQGLETGNTEWPVAVVVNDIEDYKTLDERKQVLSKALEEDWDSSTPEPTVSSRNWFGRCVFESDNNVCDEQFVTITWPESDNKPAKRVTVHMIYADSEVIVVEDFNTGETKTYRPKMEHRGHGGGDLGLTRQFVMACDRVKNHGWEAEKAQNEYVACTLEEVIRSHAMVFAAEEARVNDKVISWPEWWDDAVTKQMAA